MTIGNWLVRGVVAVVALGSVAVVAPASAGAGAAGVGGGYGRDFTGDGLPDILAREHGTGKLKVYPHSGTVDGTNTYPTAVTINAGWGGMRWIGALDLTGDGFPEVLAIDHDWRMVVAVHSGHFDGGNTLLPGLVVVGYNWNVNTLVSMDVGGLLAVRADDGKLYRYVNGKLNGTDTFSPPKLVHTTRDEQHGTDRYVSFAYLGNEDGGFVFVSATGGLSAKNVYPPNPVVGLTPDWGDVDSYLLTDLNGDFDVDIVVRDTDTGDLHAYLNSGVDAWVDPQGVYPERTVLGHGWQYNDIIT